MSDSTLVRPERSISGYSRGAELTRAIHAMWQANEATPISVERVSIVNQRIESLMAEFGLDHRLVHLAGRSKASRRKALIGKLRSQLSVRLQWVLDQTMIKARNSTSRMASGITGPGFAQNADPNPPP